MNKKAVVPMWRKKFALMVDRVKNPFGKLRLLIKQRLGWMGIPQILAFRGFGNSHEIYLKGRVLEDSGLLSAEKSDSIWKNILAMIKRYMSDELPGLRLCARFQGTQHIVCTDQSGIFDFHITTEFPVSPEDGWEQVELELLDKISDAQPCIKTHAEVLIPRPESQFGIISDVDDTIMISHATRFFKKVKLMLLKNARTRMPFEGVAGFYRALHEGQGGTCKNPIFYVSSSEWNLYDLLSDFCTFQGIPKGPFLLRSLTTRFYKVGRGSNSHDHKLDKIRHLLGISGNLKFILIGDSGQKDPEIYNTIARETPDRVAGIYIRDVRPSRHKDVLALAHALQELHIEMLLVKDTMEAARHALQMGFITEHALRDIAIEKYKDKHTPGDLQQMVKETLSSHS